MGEILEQRGDWSGATGAYQRIIDAGGKPEWQQMAEDRIAAIRANLGS
jgi:hypothetical protein